ncbi:MAG TPA: lytic murein transglycosylase [bacterium]|nr:lytic murein transglycosylase [bacterium]
MHTQPVTMARGRGQHPGRQRLRRAASALALLGAALLLATPASAEPLIAQAVAAHRLAADKLTASPPVATDTPTPANVPALAVAPATAPSTPDSSIAPEPAAAQPQPTSMPAVIAPLTLAPSADAAALPTAPVDEVPTPVLEAAKTLTADATPAAQAPPEASSASGAAQLPSARRPADRKAGDNGHSDRFTSAELEPLLRALEQLGFERHDVQKVFYDSRLRKLDHVVSVNALNPDSPDIYEQFTSPYAIHLARRFARRHWRELRAVEQKYGVPREYLVAILLVETQFGRAKLPYRVLEVFTTLAVEGHPAAVERVYERMKDKHPDVRKDWLSTRLVDKAQFAFQELVAALSMFRDNMKRLYEVRGSYAGAIGMPQFLPSSYLRWAVDGNNDGHIDLNNLDDALPSIANYLYAHGWDRDAPFADRWRSVWEYNHSTNYVRTIFEIAFRLQAPPRKHR